MPRQHASGQKRVIGLANLAVHELTLVWGKFLPTNLNVIHTSINTLYAANLT